MAEHGAGAEVVGEVTGEVVGAEGELGEGVDGGEGGEGSRDAPAGEVDLGNGAVGVADDAGEVARAAG